MKAKILILSLALSLLSATASFAGFGIGADIYSRYVWRGTDFGNSASIQPALSYSLGGFEVGAWASYPIASDVTSLGANENDLYLSYAIGNLGLTFTDYYFPEGGDVFNYSSDDGIHLCEGSLSYSFGPVSLLAGYFFSGDSDNSIYSELGFGFYESGDLSASLTIGAGNGAYVLEDDFGLVNLGLTISSGSMSVSYILNPDSETNFLVFGYSL